MKETFNPGQAHLAINMTLIIRLQIKQAIRHATSNQKIIEYLFPSSGMNRSRIRNNTIQVEQNRHLDHWDIPALAAKSWNGFYHQSQNQPFFPQQSAKL
jgi:hypothetical protein